MSTSNLEPFYEPRSCAEMDHLLLDDHVQDQDERLSWLESRGRDLPAGFCDWPDIDDEGEVEPSHRVWGAP